MKSIKISLYQYVVCLIIILALPNLLSGQGQVNLSQTRAFTEMPYIIIRPSGEIMVVWTDDGHFNGGGSLWFRTNIEGQGWSNKQQIEGATSAYPRLALDRSGNVHMAYWAGWGSYARDIYYRMYANGRWSDRELIYDSWGYNSSWVQIDVDGSRIGVLWCHNYAKPTPMDVVYIEKPIGGSWPSQYVSVSRARSSTSIHPFLKMKNGNAYATWMDDNHGLHNWNVYYSERINGYWSNPSRLVPSGNQYLPVVAIDGYENVHMIYTGRGGPTYYMRKGGAGAGWTTPDIISTANTDITTHSYMKYANGLLHAVWRQREGSGQYIFYCCGNTNGGWDVPIKVSHAGSGEFPLLDVDKQGRVHIVYSDTGVGGERDVFYVRLDQITSFPIANFNAVPTQGDPPLYVSFDASASYDPDGKIIAYNWDFGDGASGEGVQTNHIYTKKGVHTVTLTVSDDDEQSSTGNATITVGSPPIAKFSATPTAGGSPLTVFFNASESTDPDGNIISYNWDFGDGTTGVGKTVTHVYTNKGTRIATLTVTDNEGFTDSESVEIKISSDPIARIKYSPKSGEPPLLVSFDASKSKPSDKNNGKVVTYEWDFGDGNVGSGIKPKHSYKKPGDYIVTLKITDNQNMIDSTTAEVNVYAKPVARFTFSPKEGIIPLKVNFDGSKSSDEDGKISIYQWTFGDGSVGYGQKISHTYNKGGNFTVWLKVTDNDGWTNTTNANLTVLEKPYPPQTFTVKRVVNEGLFFSDYINILEWTKNNKNKGKIAVVKYLIFRKKKGSSDFVYYGETNKDTFEFKDLNVTSVEDMKSYIYGIRGVDAYGHESDTKTVDAGK